MKKQLLTAGLALIVAAAVYSHAGDGGPLSRLTRSKDYIKLFVGDFINESQDSAMQVDIFKHGLEGALLNNKGAVKLIVTPTNLESEITLSGRIKKYIYSLRDPISERLNQAQTDSDKSAEPNFAEIEVEYTVSATRTGEILSGDVVRAFIKKQMTKEKSLTLLAEKVARSFLKKNIPFKL